MTYNYLSVGTKIASVAAALAVVLLSGSSQSSSALREPASKGGAPTVLRLISTAQYENTIANIFGADVNSRTTFPALSRTNGLISLAATAAEVTPGLLDNFDNAARNVAAQVLDPDHRDVLIPCRPKDVHSADEACARAFIGKVGRLLFRRSLTPAELDTYVAVAQRSTEKTHDFYSGLQSGLSGLLVAPEFIYFVEKSEPDPARSGEMRLDGVSRASRLSLLFWDAPPDEELLRAAEKGELFTDRGLNRQVDRMLSSPNLAKGVRAFFADMLFAELFDNLAKDPVIYPRFTQRAVTDAREQMLRIVVDHLVSRNGDYRDLFTTRHIFLTRSLDMVYDIGAPTTGALDWVPYELPENDPRAGILTQIGFLTSYAHPGRSSATKRGKAVREVFMCQKVPNPPANVDFSALEDPKSPFHTARERVNFHLQNPVCAGCHKITDPIGLALENFDGAGQYRTVEGGVQIDASGELSGEKFSDARGLGLAMHNSSAVTSCLVKRLYEFGVGRVTTSDDKQMLEYLGDRFAAQGYTVPALLRTVATSRGFFQVAANSK